jgi:hypothetical protein
MVVEIDEYEGQRFIAMEFLDGKAVKCKIGACFSWLRSVVKGSRSVKTELAPDASFA